MLAPWNAQILKSTEDSLTISWDKMMVVDSYLISYFPVGHEATVKQVRVPKDQLRYEIPGLLPGTQYIIKLYQVKKGVSSDPEQLQGSTGRSIQLSSSSALNLQTLAYVYRWTKL